jgi:predicted HAD superfamily Cof-like phosphohydrolase
MKKQLNQVMEFHQRFGHPIGSNLNFVPMERAQLRFNMLKEENEEYLKAVDEGDLIEIADALGDILYILCGTIIEHGLQHKFEDVFDEIQRSNMSKLGEDGKPIYREDGKVLKGPNYSPPNIRAVLEIPE